ncbi:MAG: monovalent cation/H+ antiporter complex subunit F [Lachnospiraceae bacterium]|nr:monovalent cation/H+ antiporter complex subunit F [Lachnospiraceae bacterium]
METAYSMLYVGIMIGFALCIFCCLIRAIKGPRTMDRILAINMIGTLSVIIIAILSLYLKESFLLDVDLIYAMLSFLAVVVLTKVYMGVHREEKIREKKKEEQKKEEERK